MTVHMTSQAVEWILPVQLLRLCFVQQDFSCSPSAQNTAAAADAGTVTMLCVQPCHCQQSAEL